MSDRLCVNPICAAEYGPLPESEFSLSASHGHRRDQRCNACVRDMQQRVWVVCPSCGHRGFARSRSPRAPWCLACRPSLSRKAS